MQISVTGRHMGISDALKQYCEEKVDRLPRIFDRIQSIEVVLDGKDGDHSAEVIVHAAGAPQPFVAHQNDADAFAAVDLMMDKVAEQLRRYKEKHRNRKHPPRMPEVPPTE
jgi:putative sigma-54 modulation protein